MLTSILVAWLAQALPPAPREYHLVPLNLSIEPTLLNLNGPVPATDSFSLNVPLGGSARLRGLSISALGSVIGEDAVGLQIAGAFNEEGSGGLRGVDIAGFANWSTGPVAGVQLAGLMNRAAGPSTGLELSGVVNVAEELRGLQFAVVNIGGDSHGAQLGVVNVATAVHGAQIGFVNVASDVHGAQVGLVNVAGDVTAPMGVVDVVRDEQFHYLAWSGDSALVNVGFSFGTRRVYTLLTVGYDPWSAGDQLQAGLALGGHFPLEQTDRWWLEIDAGTLSLFEGPNLTYVGQEVFAKVRFTFGYSFSPHLSVFAGVTLNALVQRPANQAPDIGYGLEIDTGSKLTHVHLWPGPYLGLKL